MAGDRLASPERGSREAVPDQQGRRTRRPRAQEKDVLAKSDAEAIQRAEDSPDCRSGWLRRSYDSAPGEHRAVQEAQAPVRTVHVRCRIRLTCHRIVSGCTLSRSRSSHACSMAASRSHPRDRRVVFGLSTATGEHLVAETKGPRSRFPAAAECQVANHDSDRDNGIDERPARKLIAYGQRLPALGRQPVAAAPPPGHGVQNLDQRR